MIFCTPPGGHGDLHPPLWLSWVVFSLPRARGQKVGYGMVVDGTAKFQALKCSTILTETITSEKIKIPGFRISSLLDYESESKRKSLGFDFIS